MLRSAPDTVGPCACSPPRRHTACSAAAASSTPRAGAESSFDVVVLGSSAAGLAAALSLAASGRRVAIIRCDSPRVLLRLDATAAAGATAPLFSTTPVAQLAQLFASAPSAWAQLHDSLVIPCGAVELAPCGSHRLACLDAAAASAGLRLLRSDESAAGGHGGFFLRVPAGWEARRDPGGGVVASAAGVDAVLCARARRAGIHTHDASRLVDADDDGASWVLRLAAGWRAEGGGERGGTSASSPSHRHAQHVTRLRCEQLLLTPSCEAEEAALVAPLVACGALGQGALASAPWDASQAAAGVSTLLRPPFPGAFDAAPAWRTRQAVPRPEDADEDAPTTAPAGEGASSGADAGAPPPRRMDGVPSPCGGLWLRAGSGGGDSRDASSAESLLPAAVAAGVRARRAAAAWARDPPGFGLACGDDSPVVCEALPRAPGRAVLLASQRGAAAAAAATAVDLLRCRAVDARVLAALSPSRDAVAREVKRVAAATAAAADDAAAAASDTAPPADEGEERARAQVAASLAAARGILQGRAPRNTGAQEDAVFQLVPRTARRPT